MFIKLQELLKNSYSPFSHYSVAAIVVTKDAVEYSGVNVESASFGATVCAERTAINTAITNGVNKGDIVEVHVLAKNRKLGADVNSFSTPCGICRQVISEQSNKGAKVFVYNGDGVVKELQISDLLPGGFSEGDLIV